MRRLEFHAGAASEDDVRRWQKQSRPIHALSGLLSGGVGWLLVGVASLYVYHSYLNYHSRFGKPTASIDGRAFTASNVIVLVDTSDSMKGTDTILNRHLDQLRNTRVSVGNPSDVKGFGFSTTGPPDNALHVLEQALQKNSAADAIYLFSDFYPPNDAPDAYPPNKDDGAGYERLRKLLQEGHRRLYLGTVRNLPDRQLVRIARESGGNLIESK
jgi:hypothetical protein